MSGVEDVDLSEAGLAAIVARAEAATPGPWVAQDYELDGPGTLWGVRAEPRSYTSDVAEVIASAADAEHIATMDPQTTLALVAEVRRLRNEVAKVKRESIAGQEGARAWLREARRFEAERDTTRAAHAELVAGVRALVEEWDEQRRPGMVGIADRLRALLDKTTGAGDE